MEDKKKIPVEKLLTDGYIKGLDPNSPTAPNAELERGEYVQFPDGTIQEVVGNSHAEGGEKMVIPNNTKVISDTKELTLTKQNVKDLKKQYDIELTTKNTYSDAIDKYSKKIGLSKLLKDQEALFGQLKKQQEKTDSEGTLRVNNDYLSQKISEIEEQKLIKQEELSAMASKVFEQQETKKGTIEEVTQAEQIPETSELVETDDLSEDEIFKLGGTKKEDFEELCRKNGLSVRQGYNLLKEKNMLKFEEGGLYRTDFSRGRHEFSDQQNYQRKQQPRSNAAYDKITKENIETVFNNLYENFPGVLEDPKFAELITIKNGKVAVNPNIDLSKPDDRIRYFQEASNQIMQETAQFIQDNKDSRFFQGVDPAALQTYVQDELFGQGTARGFDAKLGNFTAGRFLIGNTLVTPDEYELLNKKGIKTFGKLKEAVASGDVKLSESTTNDINELSTLIGDKKVDFYLDQRTATAPVENTPAAKKSPQQSKTPGTQEQNVTSLPRKNYPKLFMTPDQSVIPPSGVQPETLGEINLQRIDPVRIGIENNLRQASENRQFVADQIESLPPGQRASAMANLLATTQNTESDAIVKTNQINAQNFAAAEQFNIGQADREAVYRTNNLLNYEARALQGLDKTTNDIRDFYLNERRTNLHELRRQQDLNLIDSLFEDFDIDFTGAGVNYNPAGQFSVEERNRLMSIMQNMNNRSVTSS